MRLLYVLLGLLLIGARVDAACVYDTCPTGDSLIGLWSANDAPRDSIYGTQTTASSSVAMPLALAVVHLCLMERILTCQLATPMGCLILEQIRVFPLMHGSRRVIAGASKVL